MTIDRPTATDEAALKELWKEAFGDTDDFINLFFRLAYSESNALCVYDNGILAAALYWFDGYIENKKVAYIYGVATKKSQRGKGFSSSLIKRTHDLLISCGYEASLLVPADEGLFRFYGKLGYISCCPIDCREYTASKDDSDIQKIGAEEYLRLRKAYLPQNTLIFDNQRLEFLASINDFYKNDNFILAKNTAYDALTIIEFFGDKTYIPSVINTLGFEKGTVRSYGNSRPFAMYFPLTDSFKITPEYLGFAFD